MKTKAELAAEKAVVKAALKACDGLGWADMERACERLKAARAKAKKGKR
jgi:hypothetical protein